MVQNIEEIACGILKRRRTHKWNEPNVYFKYAGHLKMWISYIDGKRWKWVGAWLKSYINIKSIFFFSKRLSYDPSGYIETSSLLFWCFKRIVSFPYVTLKDYVSRKSIGILSVKLSERRHLSNCLFQSAESAKHNRIQSRRRGKGQEDIGSPYFYQIRSKTCPI